jgi:hypothetical protein
MPQFIYDKLHDFGNMTAAGEFPNILALGDATVDRMTIAIHTPVPLSAGTLTFSVKGSATEGGAYTTIITGAAVPYAKINADGYHLPIPQSNYPFLKAAVAGSFTGTVNAQLDTYIGK